MGFIELPKRRIVGRTFDRVKGPDRHPKDRKGLVTSSKGRFMPAVGRRSIRRIARNCMVVSLR
jgi:hypothetical protein